MMIMLDSQFVLLKTLLAFEQTVKPRLHRRFLSHNSMQFLSRSELQLQLLACKLASAIPTISM